MVSFLNEVSALAAYEAMQEDEHCVFLSDSHHTIVLGT
jgi:hypothetical protein